MCSYYKSNAQQEQIATDSVRNLIGSGFKNIIQGHLDKGIEELSFALEYGEKIGNDSIIGSAANNLGVANFYMDNLPKAKAYYELSLKALKKAGYKKLLVANYNNFGNLYEMEKDTLNALKYYTLSRDLSIKLKDTFQIAWPSLNMGFLKFHQKKLDASEMYMKEALLYFDSIKHQHTIFVRASNTLASIAVQKNNFDKAFSHLKKSDSIAHIKEDYESLIESEKIRFSIYEKEGQSEASENSLKQQILLLESSKEKQADVLKQRNTLEQDLLNKEKTLEFTSEIQKTQGETLYKTRLFTALISMLLIVSSIFLYLLQRSNSSRKRLNIDLTNKNRSLQEAKEKTEYASKLKENFFSTISHELQTPLYAVTGITDILIDENPKKEQKKYLKTLKSSGEHLLSLINNVLQINKFDAEKIVVNHVEFDIRELIESTKDSLSYLKKENNNTIHIYIDSKVPQLLLGDSLKLKQVIINLLSNSLKFTNQGDIWLNVNVIDKTNDSTTLNISVKDNGIGISNDMQSRIFEDFSQEYMQLDRNYEGTGLGLAIVKRLLIAMNSEINVESDVGQGATFYFNINLKDVPNSKKEEAKNLLEQKTDLSNQYVLVVDDNSINQMITKRILEKKNANVTLADNGFDAIEKVKQKKFSVILMDINMPNMNGYEAARKIRAFNKDIPIIALTALKINKSNKKIIDSGISGVIVKPFLADKFFGEIEKFTN